MNETTNINNQENTRDIHLIIKAEKCPYWNFDDHTYCHTCRDCSCLWEGNNIRNAYFGVMIDGDRYCLLDCNVYGEIIKSLKKEEQFKEYRTRLNEIIDDIDNGIMRSK